MSIKRLNEPQYFLEDVTCVDTQDIMLKEFICPLCLTVAIEPMMLPCQHSMCKACATNLINHTDNRVSLLAKPSCPTCRCEFNPLNVQRNMLLSRLLDLMHVKCLSDECTWNGTYFDLKIHLQSSCKSIYMCKCEMIFDQGFAEAHNLSCGKCTVICICGIEIQKCMLDKHLQESCLDAKISCPNSEYGCLWTGFRRSFLDTHCSKCLVGKLLNEVQQYRIFVKQDCKLWNVYRKLDCFTTMGINDMERQEKLLKYSSTVYDLNFPISFGKHMDDKEAIPDVQIIALENDSILEFDLKNFNCSCKIDINPSDGVVCITFGARKDRIFIIQDETRPLELHRSLRNKLTIEFPKPPLSRPTPAIGLYANRRWLQFEDQHECPFVIEPSNRHILSLVLKCSSRVILDKLTSALQALIVH